MKECILYSKEKDDSVRCLACPHKCLIAEGKTGICGVRKNVSGKLFLLVYGKVVSMHVDPIEKKPLFHFLPGTNIFSIGTVGCNFKCDFCQNFDISQAPENEGIFGQDVLAREIVEKAIKLKCPSIAYTYNEPIIYAEFVRDCSVLAHEAGLKNIMVTNGYWSDESFDMLYKYIDAVNIDLKSIDPEFYKKCCGGGLEPVLDTIRICNEEGIHIEITTLVIPGLNDSEEEFEKIAKFISSVDPDIPWHINRFFPDYKRSDEEMTPIETLKTAYRIGKKYLNNVYVGNV